MEGRYGVLVRAEKRKRGGEATAERCEWRRRGRHDHVRGRVPARAGRRSRVRGEGAAAGGNRHVRSGRFPRRGDGRVQACGRLVASRNRFRRADAAEVAAVAGRLCTGAQLTAVSAGREAHLQSGENVWCCHGGHGDGGRGRGEGSVREVEEKAGSDVNQKGG